MLQSLAVETSPEVGVSYLHLSTDLGGHLSLSRIIMLSTPDDNGKFWHKVYYGSGKDERSYETETFLESVGCPNRPRRFKDNYHRLFEDTPEHRRILDDLVTRQDTVSWLTFLGVKEPERALADMQTEAACFREKMDELDSIFDIDEESGFGESLDFMMSVIDSKRVGTVTH